MKMKKPISKLPKSALALYIKLYCRKRGVTAKKHANILMEATKSWVSLSKLDKQYFLDVFLEYESKLKKKFAAILQTAQPYMKRKQENVARSFEDGEKLKQQKVEAHADNSHHSVSEVNENFNTNGFLSFVHNDDHKNQNHHEQFENCNIISFQSEDSTVEPDSSRLISEPTPPVRSSIELFEVIKRNSEGAMQNIGWTDLSKTQKQRYQRALSTIKNDYINQYTSYLEQLTPRQLFYHYKSKY